MKWMTPTLVALASALTTLAATPAQAQEDASCQKVRFADVGWSDIAATTGLASVVLKAMGYQPSVTVASVPITFAGIKRFERPNLTGAKYTLAVPEYLFDAGLKSFKDIARFEKELGGRILGIEPGNDGNALIAGMIKQNQHGLQKFKLVESSEAGMLAEVQRAARAKKPVVFLGWEPHPMNVQVKMKYLEGGDEVFGPNYGEAKVYTAVSVGYEARCPNVATFLRNLQFTTVMENEVMLDILNKARPEKAARTWLAKHPEVLGPWLKGVKTVKGEDAAPVVAKALGG